MRSDEILKLLDAGFTKDEILRIDGVMTDEKKTDPEPEKKADPEPEPEKKADPEPEQQKNSQQDMLQFIADQFEKMTKSIQESNILHSDNNKIENNKSAEQTLADIIAPPERKRGKI